jgi:hypothetical protein
MLDLRHAVRVSTVAVSAAILFAACGGGTASVAPAASSEESAGAPGAEVPASEAPSGVAASEEPAASEAVLPSFELSGVLQNVEGVDSYRIVIAINGEVSYQATVVNRPEKAESIVLGSGTDATRVIHIGDKAWMGTGTDSYQEVPAAMIDPLISSFSPLLLLGAFANGNVGSAATDMGVEQKNGVSARHYRIDATSAVGAFAALPAGAAIDFWVSDQGYLVAYALSGDADKTLSIDISHVNDPANEVKAPS